MLRSGDLFGELAAPDDERSAADGPLADRLRPRDLDEVVGQDELVGRDGILRRAVAEDQVPSIIFWGPPGSGKTTLARIIARRTERRYVPFSAVTSGIKEVKAVMADARRLRRAQGQQTLLFVDEIHRFNRAQQDAFLPYVECGDIVLVGATTENPSFELNAALLSRAKVVVLQPLSEDDLRRLVDRALADAERGLGGRGVTVAAAARAALVRMASGDARRLLNLLESAVDDALAAAVAEVDEERVVRVAQTRVPLYDKSGEEHFNLISALHKSVRESDADAALYWLARMLASGEQPEYLARRLTRMAVEDVGLADPEALSRVLAAWQAFERLGAPEGELALAQAVLYLAQAPKSTAVYEAYGAARQAVEERPLEPVPPALRNAPTRLMRELGHGAGYVYAPDTEEGVGGLECLPEALSGSVFYRPRAAGFESEVARRLERWNELRRRAAGSEPEGPAEESRG